MEEMIYLVGSISASLLLVGHVGWLIVRGLRRATGGRKELRSSNQLAELQQEFSRQLDAMRADVGSALEDVHDRLDFTERVITKGRSPAPDDERR